MKILKNPNITIFSGCYTPCQQGSSGGNRILKPQTNDKNIIIAGCYTPCQQGSSGGNKQLEVC